MSVGSLEGKVVVVTGGAGLLGQEFCALISYLGGLAVVADIDGNAAQEVATQLKSFGGNAEFVKLDIADQRAVDSMIANLRKNHGRIDAVVNNAYPRNAKYGTKLEDVDYHSFCENVSLHLGGYFLVSQRFALDFQRNGGGNIVNMASIYGITPPRFEIYAGTTMTSPVEYAATKAAVIQLTKYFAQYFKKSGIRCNAIAPGGIRDGQPKQFTDAYDSMAGSRGLLEPGDLRGALAFLLSDESRFVNGQVIVVDDGWSL